MVSLRLSSSNIAACLYASQPTCVRVHHLRVHGRTDGGQVAQDHHAVPCAQLAERRAGSDAATHQGKSAERSGGIGSHTDCTLQHGRIKQQWAPWGETQETPPQANSLLATILFFLESLGHLQPPCFSFFCAVYTHSSGLKLLSC